MDYIQQKTLFKAVDCPGFIAEEVTGPAHTGCTSQGVRSCTNLRISRTEREGNKQNVLYIAGSELRYKKRSPNIGYYSRHAGQGRP